MGRERIPTALVRRWLLRGALVGGAVGATLVLGAPVQAAETTPAGPVTGLLGGLTTVADDASGSVLELAAGTVDHVVPAVQDAPLVRDVTVVDDLPVTDAVRGVTDRTTGVVRELTTTVDQVLAPVVRPVDTVVIEVVPPPVVDAVPATDEGHADPDEGAATAAPAGPHLPTLRALSLSAEYGSAATDRASVAGAPLPTSAAARNSSSGSTGPTQPTGPWPVHDPATGSGSVSGTGGLAGPDLVARTSGVARLSPGSGGVRPLAPDAALAASRAPVPPFSPD